MVSREALAGIRTKIRTRLHQIISYAEIMMEAGATETGKHREAALSLILDLSEQVLRATAQFPATYENAEDFVRDLQTRALGPTQEMVVLAGQLQARCQEKSDAALSDATKLFESAREFERMLNETGTAEAVEPTPTTAAASPSSLAVQSLAAKNGTRSGGGEKGLLLVVDDNEGNRDVLSRRLLRDGCEVMLAESGRQALRMARRYKFDLILLDIMMPEMDGFAVLGELKKDPKLLHIPVIMISALDEIESVVRCIEMGADDYLMKPFNPVLLRARVNALLERKHLRDLEQRKAEELQAAFVEIQEQRAKTEQLLLNILPASVAEELQANGMVQPMYFEDVTIVFADFVGFTLSTEQLPADDLVGILHTYFTSFDNIVRRYGLEKLKTIGDCYMFVGGLPVRTPSHPVDAVLAAFDIVRATRELATQGPVDWQVRIGVHTGPVVAGVVGIHKFAFDIWGDAVNFSSRMESSGAPGRVNISAGTYLRVKDFFACEKRGKIKIKDGREVEMYFANGIAPALLPSEGMQPMKSFAQRYNTYFRKPLPVMPETGTGAGGSQS
jgi:class 3 adenylate cyclase